MRIKGRGKQKVWVQCTEQCMEALRAGENTKQLSRKRVREKREEELEKGNK